MKRNPFSYILSVAAMLALSAPITALAQYAWIDERGIKQFSDMPPPASIPANRILKQPGGVRASSPTIQDEDLKKDNVVAPTKTEMTTAEKNAEFRKRKLEQAEKEKKAADEAKVAADKAKSCERARDYQRILDSGERIARTDKNGERSFLTDEQRAQELRDARRMIEECKS